MEKTKVLNVSFTKGTKKEVLEYLFEKLKKGAKPFYIVTPNPEMIVLARKDKKFSQALEEAEIALPDGVGVLRGAEALGITGLHRITGVDFMEDICREAVEKGVSIGLLGGKNGVAEKASECLSEKYPGLKIAYLSQEWEHQGFANAATFMKRKQEVGKGSLEVSQEVDVLFVAFGFPKQELWMQENIGKLPVKAMMGVGGAFDYLSGDVPRAPSFMRDMGLEWLFRLLVQPWRLRRQFALWEFMRDVVREKKQAS